MKKLVLLASILLVICFNIQILFASDFKVKELNTTKGKPEYVKGELIVKFKNTCSRKRIKEMFGENIKITDTYSNFNIKKINLPDNIDETEILELLRNNPLVEYANLNSICYSFSKPDDPFFKYQWNFNHINMERAWNIQPSGSEDIIVAILDTGIAYEDYGIYRKAPDLSGINFCYPYDFINNDNHANDDEGHGTHVTGTICQTTNNNYGVSGMAYGISIMPIKILNSYGSGTSLSLIDGIKWAVDHGSKVINMSLGWSPYTNPGKVVEEAIKYAYEHGVVMVAASGNDMVGTVSYPAAYDEVIAVGAINFNNLITLYSQFGDKQELVAPGGDWYDMNSDGYIDGIIQETFDKPSYSNFKFLFYCGTSMAAPHVTGLISLLLTQQPSRTIVDIRNILHDTSIDLGSSGWDMFYGYGKIDAYNALNYDRDGDGYSIYDDCDNNNSSIYPGAQEICDELDNDCDGLTDEGLTIDQDKDGYSTPDSCKGTRDDCNDNNSEINPGMIEICDGLDNNCDGQMDEDVENTYYRDQDNDGYGNPSITIQACSAPSGYVSNSDDCNDNNFNINPGISEICNDGIDNNCDDIIDCTKNNSDDNCFIQSL